MIHSTFVLIVSDNIFFLIRIACVRMSEHENASGKIELVMHLFERCFHKHSLNDGISFLFCILCIKSLRIRIKSSIRIGNGNRPSFLPHFQSALFILLILLQQASFCNCKFQAFTHSLWKFYPTAIRNDIEYLFFLQLFLSVKFTWIEHIMQMQNYILITILFVN